ncbi:conjugal transfer protein [Pantoea sp. S62]|nr:conjugal transfer protein [Pantoea sp. S62]
MMAMLTEMYLHIRGESGPQALEEMIDQNLTGMSTAEDKAESKHFIKEEQN